MLRRIGSLAAFVCIPLALIAACSDNVLIAAAPSPQSSGFGANDAAADGNVGASLDGDVRMCPVTTCSLPFATCPSSQFPCDVNLLTDDRNCGRCGNSCNGWTCVEGECRWFCAAAGMADCDNNPNTACETDTRSDVNNCGTCGKKCPEGWDCSRNECVDPCVRDNRPDTCDGVCTNLKTANNNCGVCGITCNPTDPALPQLTPDMEYGCANGKCGNPECKSNRKRNCNNDLSDGCEATIGSNEHCNACFDACPAGKFCVKEGTVFVCRCADGETYCPDTHRDGPCRRLEEDPNNCGGCARECPGRGRPHFEPTCTLGVCGGKCIEHHQDCDGLSDNGCEINTRVDNRNCGACGNACAPDQVCSEGKCLVAPCAPTTPEVAK